MKEFFPLFLSIIGAGAATVLFLIGVVQILSTSMRSARREKVISKEKEKLLLVRAQENPLLAPTEGLAFEAQGVFNSAAVCDTDGRVHLFYRTIGKDCISRIGYASSPDGIHIDEHLDTPVFEIVRKQESVGNVFLRTIYRLASDASLLSGLSFAGVDDPRAVIIGDRVYVTFLAVSTTIIALRLAVVSISLEDLRARRFNWSEPIFLSPQNQVHKNWMLFPEKINGKYAVLHNLHGKDKDEIQIEYADELTEFENRTFESLDPKSLPHRPIAWHKHVRAAGPPPIKTDLGWLLLYHANDENLSQYKLGAMLLDLNDPTRVIGRSPVSILEPTEWYENDGAKEGVVYSCGAIVRDGMLMVYYGGSDSFVCLASIPLDSFVEELKRCGPEGVFNVPLVTRSTKNPLIAPIVEHPWESLATMNAATIDIDGTIHILYRAMGEDHISTLGYATSKDGVTIDTRLASPIYAPRESFEVRHEGARANSGCEDPRLTLINDTLYLCYTAYDGVHPPAGAMSTLSKEKFLKRDFSWSTPVLLTQEGVNDKDVCVFGEKPDGTALMLHRIEPDMCLDTINLFTHERLTTNTVLMRPRPHMWDSKKIGAAGTPLKVSGGWLVIYHGIDGDSSYRLGAALLSEDGTEVLSRTDVPLLEPVDAWEKNGNVPNVVFSCGQVLRGDTLFIYYGGADTSVGVATCSLKELLKKLS